MKRFTTLLLLFLGTVGALRAQTINTTIGSTGYTGNNNSGAGSFITFVIENSSANAIILTDIGNWTTTAHNGTTSTLYYSTTSLSGPITGNALPAAGWTSIASSTVAGITTTGVNPVITGMSQIIPAGATWRFALHTTGTNYYSGTGVGTASPNTFNVGGIIMRTGDYQIGGQYVGYGFSNNPRFFTGFVTFMPATPCAGAPTAGTISYSPGCPATVSLNGFTMASGITIQWQKKTGCTANWVNIPGATSSSYTIGSQSSAVEYRAYIVCNNSGLSDTSAVVLVSSVAPCYCSSNATSTADTELFGINFSNINNPNNCGQTGGPGSMQNQYSDYTTVLPAMILSKGTTYPFTIQVGSCGGSFNNGVAVYLDYNINGLFDANERIYVSAAAVSGAHTETGSYLVPLTAATGLTRMRVIVMETTAPSTAITACGTYTWGETEDYLVQILYAPEATGGGVFCSGQNTTLVGSAPNLTGNYTYLWRRPNGTFDTTQNIVLNNLQVSDAGIYTLRMLTYPCGGSGVPDTSGKKEISVAVNQTPPAPIVAPVIVYCQYEHFDSIAIFGQNLKWYSVPVGGIGSTIEPVVNTSIFGSVTYYVSQTVTGCEGPRAPVTINVVPKPNPPDAESEVVYCQGEVAAPLQAVGQNLLWYSVAQGGVGTPITPTPTTNAQGIYTWYVSQTVAGCESNRIPVTVRVSYVPNAMITVNRPYVCQYDTMSLSYFGNATPDADYLWSLPAGATLESGAGQGPLVVRFDVPGVHRVGLQVDNGGCKGPATYLDITVRAVPVLALDMQPDACVGDIVNLAVAYVSTSVDQYNWDFMGGETVYGAIPTGPYGLKWSTPGIKTITVVATDDDCSSLPVTDQINVHALPDASITAVDGVNICAGDSVWLEAAYDRNSSYRWEPEQYFGVNNTNRELARIDFKSYVYLTVTNEYNCKGRDSLFINAEPCCEVFFPNAFTPNGDGKNDVFRMIRRGGSQEISTFRIVNRWGHTVFETADENTGWDGNFNGKPQDMGTYHYFIRYKCGDGNFYEDKGDIILMR